MKRLAGILTSVLALFLYGCSVDIDGINDRLDSLEARVQALEELCAQINTNVSSLQAIVDASQTGDYITSVVPVTEGDKTVGYTISFVKGAPITIYHGKDGEDGKDGENGVDGSDGTDGYTPKISAAKDEDGVYYWTLDGEWLLDASGQKIPVQGSNGADGEDGADGVTPQFKIEEGIWYVSYDGGAGWIQLSEAVSDDGDIVYDSIFEEVRDEEGSVTFVLHDGGTIVIPKMSEFNLFFEEPEIIAMGVDIARVLTIIVLLQIAQVIYMGCLRGAGDVIFTTIASTLSITFIRPIFSYLLCYACGLGLIGIWLGIAVDQFSRFCLTTWRFKSGKWMNIKI